MRERPLTPLQERFVRSGFESFDERETVELFLSFVVSHLTVKRVAKECIERFGNLTRLLAASQQELEQVGLSLYCICGIRLLHELPAEVLKQKIIEQPVHSSSKDVFDYLYYSMRDLKKEVFKVIYLNSRNQIIDTTDLFEGTEESISIRPREVIESAIKHNAVSLIFVHNHPSGNPTPSRSDKRLTRDMVFVGSIILIKLLDHIIIGDNRYFSFADEGLIEKYEFDFLNLKIRRVSDS